MPSAVGRGGRPSHPSSLDAKLVGSGQGKKEEKKKDSAIITQSGDVNEVTTSHNKYIR